MAAKIRLYERPREKLTRGTITALRTGELVQLIIGTGGAGSGVEKIARKITHILRHRPHLATVETLMRIEGVGIAKAAQVTAAIELSKRLLPRHGETVDEALREAERYLLADVGCYFVLVDGTGYAISKNMTPMHDRTAAPEAGRHIMKKILAEHAAGLAIVHQDKTKDEPTINALELARILRCVCDMFAINIHAHILITRQESIRL